MDHQVFAQMLGNYGEFIGSIAVLATLVYVAIQVRQNTKNANAATSYDVVREVNAINMQLGLNKDLARLFSEAHNNPDGLDHEQFQQAGWIVLSYINILLKAYWLRSQGTIADDAWRDLLKLATMARTPGGRRIVKPFLTWWDASFIEILELDKPVARWADFGDESFEAHPEM